MTCTAMPDPPLCEDTSILDGEGQLPIPSEPQCLVESVVELRWAMEPLASFTEEEVLAATVPSNWVEVSSPWLAKPTPLDTHYSHSCNTQAHLRGSLSAAHSED